MKTTWMTAALVAAAMICAPAHAGGGKAKTEAKGEAGDYATLSFRRPFVIPVGTELRTTGMVVVSFNIEIDRKDYPDVQEREELIRDRILSALMGLSHGGHFDGGITDPEIASLIKNTVHQTLETLFPGITGEVLIQDLLSRRVV